MQDLAGKNIVLGMTGGIAAYKAAELCRLLVKAGAQVRVIMTDAATRFITPLTLQTLSGAPVARDLFELDGGEAAGIGHIRLGDEADLIVIAPATADAIARLAAGRADDVLTATVLASRAPVLLAPAMNVNMWTNPLTQRNLGTLLALDRFRTVGPDAGDLACGWVGAGRLIEPAEIVAAAARLLSPGDLVGRRIVVTAGPTHEPIDDVRFIGNRSSGKMGFAVAEAAARRGADVTLIAGPVALATPPGAGITRRDVETAEQMRGALRTAVAEADAVVMVAAVADFRPARRLPGKLSRRAKPSDAASGTAGAGEPSAPPITDGLPLVANPDLLAELGSVRRRGGRAPFPLLVGFAAETGTTAETLVTRARAKLVEKGCDVVVANDVGEAGLGFGSDENAVTLVFADGTAAALARASKGALADRIWDQLVPRLGAPARATRSAARAAAARRPKAVRPPPLRRVRPAPVRGRRG